MYIKTCQIPVCMPNIVPARLTCINRRPNMARTTTNIQCYLLLLVPQGIEFIIARLMLNHHCELIF